MVGERVERGGGVGGGHGVAREMEGLEEGARGGDMAVRNTVTCCTFC